MYRSSDDDHDTSSQSSNSSSSTVEIPPRILAPVIQPAPICNKHNEATNNLNNNTNDNNTATTTEKKANNIVKDKGKDKDLSKESKASFTTLTDLPEDVVLRIIAHTGDDLSMQIGVAYTLGSLNSRLLRILKFDFLPSLTKFSPQCLKSLSLSDSAKAHAAFMSLFECTTALREIDFSGCTPSLLSPSVMRQLSLRSADTLRSISLAYCCIGDNVVKPLLENCHSLNHLSMVSCDGPTGETFHKNICKAPLVSLDLSNLRSLTLEGLKCLSTLSTVQNLSLKGCDVVSSHSLPCLFNCHAGNFNFNHNIHSTSYHISNMNNENVVFGVINQSLVSIDLSYCPIVDAGLLNLVESSPKLKTLILAEHTANLWSTGDFTPLGIRMLRQKFPHVQVRFLT